MRNSFWSLHLRSETTDGIRPYKVADRPYFLPWPPRAIKIEESAESVEPVSRRRLFDVPALTSEVVGRERTGQFWRGHDGVATFS